MNDSVLKPGPMIRVIPAELGRRIETMKKWFAEMPDSQRTVAFSHLVVIWFAQASATPYPVCLLFWVAKLETSHVLQSNKNKWYRGRHTFISVQYDRLLFINIFSLFSANPSCIICPTFYRMEIFTTSVTRTVTISSEDFLLKSPQRSSSTLTHSH